MGRRRTAAPSGGPLRRRRAKRQLVELAGEPQRDPSPAAARAHVKVIGDQAAAEENRVPEEQAPDAPAERSDEKLPPGFHVRAVPIDQPFPEP
ncbi:MAG: hypothetical protein ACLPVF_13390 [Acidimicrobiales bacterium]